MHFDLLFRKTISRLGPGSNRVNNLKMCQMGNTAP